MIEKKCATCHWHQYEPVTDGEVCVNSDSGFCADWTDDEFCCKEWEARDEEEFSFDFSHAFSLGPSDEEV